MIHSLWDRVELLYAFSKSSHRDDQCLSNVDKSLSDKEKVVINLDGA